MTRCARCGGVLMDHRDGEGIRCLLCARPALARPWEPVERGGPALPPYLGKPRGKRRGAGRNAGASDNALVATG